MKAWCAGKQRSWRIVLLLLLFWVFWDQASTRWGHDNLLREADTLIHEAGHELWRWAGEFMHIAGGCLNQCLFPVIVGIEFWFVQKDYYAVSLCLGWLAENLYNVGTYASTARSLDVPGYACLGGECNLADSHDWRQLLLRTGHLAQDQEVARFFWILAWAAMAVCIIWCAWLLLYMEPKKKEVEGGDAEAGE
jgi:hypothetical protein